MGKPNLSNVELFSKLTLRRRRPGEVKHLSNQRKRKRKKATDFHSLITQIYLWDPCIEGLWCDSLSSGERKGNSQNLYRVVLLLNVFGYF